MTKYNHRNIICNSHTIISSYYLCLVVADDVRIDPNSHKSIVSNLTEKNLKNVL